MSLKTEIESGMPGVREARTGGRWRVSGIAATLPAVGLLLASCASLPFQSGALRISGFSASLGGPAPAGKAGVPAGSSGGGSHPEAFASRNLTPTQEKLLEGARYFEGKSSLSYKGRSFTYDCSGTILAIYYYAGIDLQKRFGRYSGSGVARIYAIMRADGLLYSTSYPEVGDIIFWDNTYDANGNGKWDDELTHAGMVVDVTPDGEITFIHENYAEGIVLGKMNLFYPAVATREEAGALVVVNSPMRMRGQPPGPGIWAGQLFKVFGKGYDVPD